MAIETIRSLNTWTVDDYLQLEEGLLAQLIDGEIVMSPAPTPLHQRTLRNLYNELNQANLKGELLFAPIDLFIDHKNVLQPDLVFITHSKANIVTERGIEGAPDLVIEILSPSNSHLDRSTKKRLYFEVGVVEYWMVDPRSKTVEIFTNSSDAPILYSTKNTELNSPLLSGTTFQMENVFPPN